MSASVRLAGAMQELGEREVAVIASTDQLARDGHIVIPSGIDVSAFRNTPTVLFNHNPEKPVGAATHVGVEAGMLGARIRFADAGLSATADEVCALVKSGVLSGISIGFLPRESEPINPREPFGGLRITACDLLEISVVAVPADTGARVVARSFSTSRRRAIIRSLRPVSHGAVDRVMARFQRPAGPAPQFDVDPHDVQRYGITVAREIARQKHYATMGHAYVAERRERDREYTREALQRRLATLGIK
jgi:HK97 family phage prohead protease